MRNRLALRQQLLPHRRKCRCSELSKRNRRWGYYRLASKSWSTMAAARKVKLKKLWAVMSRLVKRGFALACHTHSPIPVAYSDCRLSRLQCPLLALNGQPDDTHVCRLSDH